MKSMLYMTFTTYMNYLKHAFARKPIALGGVALLAVMALVGLWVLSASPMNNATDARAALVDGTGQQSQYALPSGEGQDGFTQSPVETPPTPVTAEPTPEPSAMAAPSAVPAQASPAPQAPATRGGARAPAATVALDPGHGGWDSGAVYKDPAGGVFTEKEATLQVALRVQKLLAADGLKVVMTRTSDASVGGSPKGAVGADLQARVDIANAANADVLVSIHFNSSGSPASRGTETIYNANRPFSAQNLRLAQYVNSALISSMQATGYTSQNRGVKTDQSTGRGQFYLLAAGGYVTRPSRMPAVIGEGLFISNPTEAALLKKPEFLDTLAQAYANAIISYFTE